MIAMIVKLALYFIPVGIFGHGFWMKVGTGQVASKAHGNILGALLLIGIPVLLWASNVNTLDVQVARWVCGGGLFIGALACFAAANRFSRPVEDTCNTPTA